MGDSTYQPDTTHLVALLLEPLTDRQREVIARKFGLYGPQMRNAAISRQLGTSRQNVDNVASSASQRLSTAMAEKPELVAFQTQLTSVVRAAGGTMRADELLERLNLPKAPAERARLAFLTWSMPDITEIPESRGRYAAASQLSRHDLDRCIDQLVAAAQRLGEPASIAVLARKADMNNILTAEAAAGISKHLGRQDGRWGLAAWAAIHPRFIRDRIFNVLQGAGRPMHFSEIVQAIRVNAATGKSNVTVGAVHNELVWDLRFIRVGPGTYALKEWGGYTDGSLRSAIIAVLEYAGEPIDVKTIVERVQVRWNSGPIVIRMTIQRLYESMPQIERVERGVYRWRP